MVNKLYSLVGMVAAAAFSVVALFGTAYFSVGLLEGTNSVRTSTTTLNVQTLNTSTNEVKLSQKTISNLIPGADNIVHINGPIGKSVAEAAKAILNNSAHKLPTYLIINSYGGSVIDGAQVLSAIEASETPVYTVCVQMCISMAAIIHQYGTKRYVVDRAILMFHDASGQAQGTFPEMASRVAFTNSYANKMNAYVALRAKLTLNDFLLRIKSEIWLDADEAVSLGFADELVSINLSKNPVPSRFELEYPSSKAAYPGAYPGAHKLEINWAMPALTEGYLWNTLLR